MSKLLFLPFQIFGALLARFLGKRAFKASWAMIDNEQPPKATDRNASWSKVVTGLALEAAIFAAARGIVERASRQAFSKVTGAWPGDEAKDAHADRR